MLLTIAKCRDLDYYEREVIDGREEYLSEDGASPVVGSAALPPETGSPASPTVAVSLPPSKGATLTA